MSNKPKGFSHFWKEVKRRNVLRSLAIYAGTAFIILEACSLIFPRWGLPDWSIDLVLYLLILGVFINVIVSWIFNITPQGMQKTKPLEESQAIEKPSDSLRWKAATYVSLVVIVALIIIEKGLAGQGPDLPYVFTASELYEEMQGNPRYLAILEKMGLPSL